MIKAATVAIIFFAVTVISAFAQDDIQKTPSCKYCGMDRQMFSHSRMHIDYDDGSATGTCSLHCTALELALTMEKIPKALLVADYVTKKQLIDAEKAVWVVGGAVQGVMTMNAKWAFEKKTDADTFIQKNGGKLATFEDALKIAYEEMYQDTRMIREKRKMKKMQMAKPGSIQ